MHLDWVRPNNWFEVHSMLVEYLYVAMTIVHSVSKFTGNSSEHVFCGYITINLFYFVLTLVISINCKDCMTILHWINFNTTNYVRIGMYRVAREAFPFGNLFISRHDALTLHRLWRAFQLDNRFLNSVSTAWGLAWRYHWYVIERHELTKPTT